MPTSSKKLQSRGVDRWLSYLGCPLMIVTAIVMAFPQVVGSTAEPTYSLAISFLGLAVVFGIKDYTDSFETPPDKH